MIKKTIIVMLVLTVLLLISCEINLSSDNITSDSQHKIQMPETVENTEINPTEPEWHTAYCDYILNDFDVDMGFITLGLADLDNNGVPELIIYDDSKGSLSGGFTIVTINNNGNAERIFSAGLRSLYIVSNDEIYFYRDFDALPDSGGMVGYGYVYMIKNINGELKCTALISAGISDYDVESDERDLYWSVGGEENVLKQPEFKKYLYIKKAISNDEWEDITPDEYLNLKKSYLGDNPNGKTVWDLVEIRHDCFDEDNLWDSQRFPDKSEIDDFFENWYKN